MRDLKEKLNQEKDDAIERERQKSEEKLSNQFKKIQ